VFHIPSLDGIRALSFLVVFAAHAGLDRVVPGGFGVTVFFFLSGYLITTLLRKEHDERGTVSLRRFAARCASCRRSISCSGSPRSRPRSA